MGDEEKNLRVKITVTNDQQNGGAQGAAEGIRKVTDATKKGSDANEEHKHTIAGINLEMGEHRRILAEVDKAIPGAVEGLRALTSGLGAFGAALSVFALAKEKLAEYNKGLDETAALMAESYGNLAAEIAAANREIAETAAAANSELVKIKETQRGIAEQTDAATAAIKRHEQAQIALTDATAAYQLAKVDADKKSGAIDDVTAARMEAQIKHAAELRRNQIENTADQGAAGQKNNELDNAVVEQHRVQGIVDAGATGESFRQAKIKDAPAEIESFTKLLAKANDEVKKNQEAYDQAVEAAKQNASDNRNGTGLNVPSDEQSQAAFDAAKLDLDVSQAKQKGYQKEINNISDSASKYKTDQKLFEDAKATLAEVSQKVKSLTAELSTMLTTAQENAASRQKIADIHNATEGVKLPPSPFAGPQSPQDKYNVSQYGATAPGGAGIDPSKFPPQIQTEVAQYKTDFAAYTAATVSGFRDMSGHVKEQKAALDRELAKIKQDIADLHSGGQYRMPGPPP